MVKGIIIGILSALFVMFIVFLLDVYTFMSKEQPVRDYEQDIELNNVKRKIDFNYDYTTDKLDKVLNELKTPIEDMQKDINDIKVDVRMTKKVVKFMGSTLKEMKKYQMIFNNYLASDKDTVLLLTKDKK